MGIGAASNAVLAKARAMYGKRLTAQNYDELIACRTVADVAAYLKTRTDYAAVFEGVNTTLLRRTQLESLIRERLQQRFASLCRYEKSIGDKFYEYFVMNSDVELLLHAVRFLNRAHPEDSQRRVPELFYRNSHIDARSLNEVGSFEELMRALKGSPYFNLLAPFSGSGEGSQPDYFGMELALNKYFYSRGTQLIKKSYAGKERRELRALFAMLADLDNIVAVYRLKRMTKKPDALLSTALMPGGTFSEKEWSALLSAPDERAMLEQLRGGDYEAFCEMGDSSVEDVAGRIKYDFCRSKIRFSTSPCVVMLSFVTLAENEAFNLIHITEGIRYGLPPEQISELLIGVGD